MQLKIESRQLTSSEHASTTTTTVIINHQTGESRSNDSSRTSSDQLEERLPIGSGQRTALLSLSEESQHVTLPIDIPPEAVSETVIPQEDNSLEAIRLEDIRPEATRQGAIRQEAEDNSLEADRREAIRLEAIRQEAIRQEALRQEAQHYQLIGLLITVILALLTFLFYAATTIIDWIRI